MWISIAVVQREKKVVWARNLSYGGMRKTLHVIYVGELKGGWRRREGV